MDARDFVVGSALLVVGCGARESDSTTVAIAPASATATAAASNTAVASGEPPCPPQPSSGWDSRRIREGSAVLNASPFDLPRTGSSDAPPRVSFETARAAAGSNTAELAIWLDGDTWHVRANGSAAQPGTLFQARVSFVADVAPEGEQDKLTVHDQARMSPGRCWNDPPQTSSSARYAGFDWRSTPGAAGIRFTTRDACFRVTLRVGEREQLPRVVVGTTPISAGKLQDTIELCQPVGSGP